MQLADYWRIIWLRRGLILTLALATLAASTVFTLTTPPLHRTSIRILVRPVLPPVSESAPLFYSREYFTTLFAEYIQDDLSEIIKSHMFASDVNRIMRARYGEEYDENDIAAAFATKKTHRTVKITIETPGADRTFRIADAADEVIRQKGAEYFSQLGQRFVFVDVIDPPRKPVAPSLPRRLLDVLLHTSVALTVGSAIAIVLRLLDDKLYDPVEVVSVLELPLLAVVPPETPTSAVHASGARGAHPRMALLAKWLAR